MSTKTKPRTKAVHKSNGHAGIGAAAPANPRAAALSPHVPALPASIRPVKKLKPTG